MATGLALALAGCTASAAPDSPKADPPALAACTGHVLRINAGREGESAGAHGDVEFTNTGASACVLRGVPRVTIIRTDGRTLHVTERPQQPGPSLRQVTLAPGRRDAAELVIYWFNWCGRPPGPLSVRVRLPGGGVVTGPFDGPPDYDYVPICLSRGQPSTISVLQAYEPE
jgi:uncharacterized protein DUF4232